MRISYYLAAAVVSPIALQSKPPALTAGDAWTARIAVNARATHVLVRAAGAPVEAVRVRPGLYAAHLLFPTPGRFAVSARLGRGAWQRLGTVRVASLRIVQPAKLTPLPDGTLLVADPGGKGIATLNPNTRAVTLRARGSFVDVARAPDGALYGLSPNGLLEVGKPGVVARIDGATGLALGDGVAWVVDYGGALHRVDLASGRSTIVADGFDRPHGVALDGDAVLVADTYAGTIWRVDGNGNRMRVASGLGRPISIAPAGATLYVSDSEGRRVLRVANGTATVVAHVTGQPTGIAFGGGSLYVAQVDGDFTVARVDVATGALTPLTR
jgi:NHL repeat